MHAVGSCVVLFLHSMHGVPIVVHFLHSVHGPLFGLVSMHALVAQRQDLAAMFLGLPKLPRSLHVPFPAAAVLSVPRLVLQRALSPLLPTSVHMLVTGDVHLGATVAPS